MLSKYNVHVGAGSELVSPPQLTIQDVHLELHGVLRGVPAGVLPLGATLQLVPGHCDPTVNLHDRFYGFGEDGAVEVVWPIDARGFAPPRAAGL